MSEIARADRRAARCFARVEDGCRSGRLESLSTQRAPHPSLGSQYWFTRIYVHTCTRGWNTYPGIDPQRLRVVDEYTDRCVAPPPKYRWCRGADSSGNATFVLYIVLTRLFVSRFIFQRYRISSLSEIRVSRLPYRNYAKRQNDTLSSACRD